MVDVKAIKCEILQRYMGEWELCINVRVVARGIAKELLQAFEYSKRIIAANIHGGAKRTLDGRPIC